MTDMIQCGYCGGRGRVARSPYDRDGRYAGPREMVCDYCEGSGQLERSHAAERLLPATVPHDDGGPSANAQS